MHTWHRDFEVICFDTAYVQNTVRQSEFNGKSTLLRDIKKLLAMSSFSQASLLLNNSLILQQQLALLLL